MPTRHRWSGLVLLGLITPILAAQPSLEGGHLPEPGVGQPVIGLPVRREPYDPFQYPLSAEQKKLLDEIARLGGRASINATPDLDSGDPNKPPKWGPVYSTASINALDDEFGKKLATLLPLLKQLPNLQTLRLEAIEITEADLRQFGQLRDATGLRSVSISYRRLPANAKWVVRTVLPQLPLEPMDWFHRPDSLLEPAIHLGKLSALTEFRPRAIDPDTPPRRRLQIERYNVAIERHRISWRAFRDGRFGPTIESFKPAGEALLRSALDLCDTPAERVRVWELYVESMAEDQQIIEARLKAGLRGTTEDQYRAQVADHLAARIELLKAREAAEKRP